MDDMMILLADISGLSVPAIRFIIPNNHIITHARSTQPVQYLSSSYIVRSTWNDRLSAQPCTTTFQRTYSSIPHSCKPLISFTNRLQSTESQEEQHETSNRSLGKADAPGSFGHISEEFHITAFKSYTESAVDKWDNKVQCSTLWCGNRGSKLWLTEQNKSHVIRKVYT